MANQKYTILYGRLSQEDDLKGDSNSILNQQMLMEKYARDNGFTNAKFLYDDGYSGTNFNRPAWNELLALIEKDEVETLIVKDLSRLGRDYLQVGYYTEIYFPKKGIRFVAMHRPTGEPMSSSSRTAHWLPAAIMPVVKVRTGTRSGKNSTRRKNGRAKAAAMRRRILRASYGLPKAQKSTFSSTRTKTHTPMSR